MIELGCASTRSMHLAKALSLAMKDPKASSASLAKKGWQVLWPSELRRKQAIYKFGLEKLMRFEEKLLRGFFVEFFSLPNKQWYGFLTNTLSLKELISAMWKMFRKSPWTIKQGLMNMHGSCLLYTSDAADE